MTKDEEKVLTLLQLKPWQRRLTTPALAISTHQSGIKYHDLLDTKDCDPGEINTITYSEERPEGIPGKIHRRQLFGILDKDQFGTAASWAWPGLEFMPELLFGDPDWSVLPFKGDNTVYDVGYIPRPSKVNQIYQLIPKCN